MEKPTLSKKPGALFSIVICVVATLTLFSSFLFVGARAAEAATSEWHVSWWNFTGWKEWGYEIGESSFPAIFDYDWKDGAIFGEYKDNIGFKATMEIYVNKAEPVFFEIGSDDGSRLFVDGEMVIDNWEGGVYRTKSVTLNLDVGKHYLELWYFEGTGWARVSFECDQDVLIGQEIEQSIPPWTFWVPIALGIGGITVTVTVLALKKRKKAVPTPSPPGYPPKKPQFHPDMPQTCPGCGVEVKPEMVHCHRCGRRLRLPSPEPSLIPSAMTEIEKRRLGLLTIFGILFGAIVGYKYPQLAPTYTIGPLDPAVEQTYLVNILIRIVLGALLGGSISRLPTSRKLRAHRIGKKRAMPAGALTGGLLGFLLLVLAHTYTYGMGVVDYTLWFGSIIVGCTVGAVAGLMLSSTEPYVRTIGAGMVGAMFGIIIVDLFLVLLIAKAQTTMGIASPEFRAYTISLLQEYLIPLSIFGGLLGSISATTLIVSKTKATKISTLTISKSKMLGSAIRGALFGSLAFWAPVTMKPELFFVSPTISLIVGGLLGGIAGVALAVPKAYAKAIGEAILLAIALSLVGVAYAIMLYDSLNLTNFFSMYLGFVVGAGGPLLFYIFTYIGSRHRENYMKHLEMSSFWFSPSRLQFPSHRIIARIYLAIAMGFIIAVMPMIETSGYYHNTEYVSRILKPLGLVGYIVIWALLGTAIAVIGRLLDV